MSAILGISSYFHDSAACLVVDGIPIAAAQEERFSRRKGDARFPANAIDYVLSAANVSPSNVDSIAFYENPHLKFDRIIDELLHGHMPSTKSTIGRVRSWLSTGVGTERLRRDLSSIGLGACTISVWQHHQSHAAAAFLASPFDSSAVLCVDAVGEYGVTSGWFGAGNKLSQLYEDRLPNSLGLFYSALTSYCGFEVNEGEYKLMGLAPYGEPRFVGKLRESVIEVNPEGETRINRKFIDVTGGPLVTPALERLLGRPRRGAGEALGQFWADVAKSAQVIFEGAFIGLAHALGDTTSSRNLCLAGGSALNSAAVGKLERTGKFHRIWTQPAAGDAGSALGAALLGWIQLYGDLPQQPVDRMSGTYLGPAYSTNDIEKVLKRAGVNYSLLNEAELINAVVDDIVKGKIVGWFQGPMEFGPRALGSRSILADPRQPEMTQRINQAVKFREAFRPIAPAVLEESAQDYFDLSYPSPYMTRICRLRPELLRADEANNRTNSSLSLAERLSIPRSTVPAITHVDGTARPQTVTKTQNRLFHSLISEFNDRVGIPMLCNTSLNRRDEPIAMTPDDALQVFFGTELDGIAMGNFYVSK